MAGPAQPAGPSRVGYGLPPEMGMFVVTPATSFGPIFPHQPDPGPGPGAFMWPHSNPNSYMTPEGKRGTINFDPGGGPGTGSGSGSGGLTATCQDCGNQAKKDCGHRRCRTCCRSRGFDCLTHVKSTWVPAARRRERQLLGGGRGGGGGGGGGASSGSTSGVKKPRLVSSTTTSHTSTSNTNTNTNTNTNNNINSTPPRSFETGSSHQDASFKETLPGQVRAPAVFKCVKVSAVVDGGNDEFAYQAVVKIGGHIFKGFLYDQGLDPRDGFPNFSDLHLGGGGGGGSGGGEIVPDDVYVASRGGGGGGGLVDGSNYGNAI